jgi:hypothetical protein
MLRLVCRRLFGQMSWIGRSDADVSRSCRGLERHTNGFYDGAGGGVMRTAGMHGQSAKIVDGGRCSRRGLNGSVHAGDGTHDSILELEGTKWAREYSVNPMDDQ